MTAEASDGRSLLLVAVLVTNCFSSVSTCITPSYILYNKKLCAATSITAKGVAEQPNAGSSGREEGD